MIRKILFIVTVASFVTIPASAQSFYAEFSYQSFRPYIHFQLEIGSHHQRFNPYQESYLKGYMDGVNATYYGNYRFYEMVSYIEAYEAGYRDGLRDQRLFLQLRGYNRLPGRPFAYRDYYSPYYSVQIWLNQLTFTFIQAPEHRLPRYWTRRVHPSVKKYRNRVKHRRFYTDFKTKYKRHNQKLRRRAQNNYRERNRSKQNRAYGRQHQTRPRLNRNRAIERVRNRGQQGQTVRRGRAENGHHVRSRSTRPGRTVGKRTSRGSRVEKKSPEKRQKVRSRSRSGNSRERVKRSRGNRGGNSKGRSNRRGVNRKGGRGNNG